MQKYSDDLKILKQNSIFRSIKNIKEKTSKYILVDEKKMLNLSSNDYLNIASNKDLISEFLEKYSSSADFLFSSASARLLTGNLPCYNKLEENFSKLYEKSSLLFNTGYQCNQGIVSTLFSKGDVIFCDKLNHASIISGLKLSQAEHFRYRHNDYDCLEKMLKEKRNFYKNAVIITESVFSMDGDISNLKRLTELKKKYDCLLMVDEAHAFGVFGDGLLGVSQKEGLIKDIDIITVTLGKALGSSGAVCLSNKTIIEYLINHASSFIFSTAIPSVNVMWSNFLLEEKFDFLLHQKEKLNSLFNYVHKIYPSISSSQIIPVITGDEKETAKKAKILREKGFYVLPINPPTVPKGTSRLRVSLTADIEKGEIEKFFEVL